MSLDDRPEKKLKNLTFTYGESPTEDNLSEALISKKFNKSLNKIQARWRTNSRTRCPTSSNRTSQKRTSVQSKIKE
jgi:hypothetical protein